MARSIFVLGYPGPMGGANTECRSTVRLWREAGWDVSLIPTWGKADPTERAIMDSYGCRTIDDQHPGTLQFIEGLRGQVVVAFCNVHSANALGILRQLGCKFVWVNCMTFLFPHEMEAFVKYGPADAYMFQSKFQRNQIEPRLMMYGHRPERGFIIHGAWFPDDLPFHPRSHAAGEEFVIGKLSRPDQDKSSMSS